MGIFSPSPGLLDWSLLWVLSRSFSTLLISLACLFCSFKISVYIRVMVVAGSVPGRGNSPTTVFLSFHMILLSTFSWEIYAIDFVVFISSSVSDLLFWSCSLPIHPQVVSTGFSCFTYHSHRQTTLTLATALVNNFPTPREQTKI